MRDLVWVLPLALLVTVGTWFSGGGADPLVEPLWPAVVLAGLACLALPSGRARAEAAVTVPGVLVAAYFALGFHDGPVYLPLIIGSYVAAWLGSLRRWVPATVVAIVLVAVGMVVRVATTDTGWWEPFWQALGTAGLVSAAGLVGLLVRSRQHAARERERRAATEEQLQMARDLHDGVGHGLAVIAMQAGVALHVLDKDTAAVREGLQAIRETSHESLEALRGQLSVLAGDAPTAPRHGLSELDALLDRVRGAGLEVELRRTGWAPEVAPVPAEVDATAYAIVQEALTNVLRHARASTTVVDLARDSDELRILVTDDGHGGGVARDVVGEGMGIAGMRARAASVGGLVRVGPEPGSGFRVDAVLPLARSGV